MHRLWLTSPSRPLATIQFILHQVGCLGMFVGLLLLYGHTASEEQVGPLLGPTTLAIILGMLLMLVMALRTDRMQA